MPQTDIIALQKATHLAENKAGGQARGIHLRKMHGDLVYVADIMTPQNKMAKVILDAGDGRVLFIEKQ